MPSGLPSWHFISSFFYENGTRRISTAVCNAPQTSSTVGTVAACIKRLTALCWSPGISRCSPMAAEHVSRVSVSRNDSGRLQRRRWSAVAGGLAVCVWSLNFLAPCTSWSPAQLHCIEVEVHVALENQSFCAAETAVKAWRNYHATTAYTSRPAYIA